MKTYLTSTITTVLAIVSQLAFAVPAFAIRDNDAMGGLSFLRQDTRLSEVKIQGSLFINENALMIKDTKNGKLFNLTDAADAYRMYSNGQKNVAIEGMITASDTIRVSRVTAL